MWLLIKRGANLAATDCEKTPLYKAVERGQIKDVRLLLDAGANVSIRYPGRDTILHLVAGRLDAALVGILLNHGPNPNEKGEHGMTPLHYAVMYGSESIALLLLKAGASVQAKDNSGYTAMMRARNTRYEEVVSLLRDK